MSNESDKEWAWKKFQDVEVEGKKFSGVSPDLSPTEAPKWFNRRLFDEAVQLSSRYYSGLLWGQFIGLMLVLNYPEGVAPLIVTGNSSTVAKLFRRYLSTMIHVKNWMEFDPFKPESESFKSLSRVRGMHRHVAKKMNEKSCRVEGQSDELWISQFSMCHAQFSFIGITVLYPEQCGLYLKRRQMEALIHFWRVIGYCLGTDDRFNLCQGTYEQTFELCTLIFNQAWRPIITKQLPHSPAGIEMAKGICLAMNTVNPFINYNVVLSYWEPIVGIPLGSEQCSWKERWMLKILKFTMKYVFWFNVLHMCSSAMARMRLRIASWLRNSKEKRLMEQYKELNYDNTCCPFDVKFEYRDVFQKSVPLC